MTSYDKNTLQTLLSNSSYVDEAIRLLGENLVAFRDTTGRVGLLQGACPHRRASLFWGRNEEDPADEEAGEADPNWA